METEITTAVDIAKLRLELENVCKEISAVREQIAELSEKQTENIEGNSKEIHILYDRVADLNTKLELIKQKLDALEKNLKELHTSNRTLIVKNEVLEAKYTDLERRTAEDHTAIETLRITNEHKVEKSNSNWISLAFSIGGSLLVAIITTVLLGGM